MTTLRHTLALSAISLLGCISESPWENAWDWNDHGGLSRGDSQTSDDGAENAVDWGTPFVDLHADEFRISVGGKSFLGHASDASLKSDPGTDTYTTLERIWTENGVEMRLFIYFYSDGTDWWAGEIRIYDGQSNPDWLAATGEWFRRPLGQSFAGDLDLTLDVPAWSSADGGSRDPGRLTMHGLQLQAFDIPDACLDQSSDYVMQGLDPTMKMTTSPNTSFGLHVWVRDRKCEPVADTDFTLVWAIDDPSIVELAPPNASSIYAQLRGSAVGETTLRVVAKRRSDSVVLAQGTTEVSVSAAR